MGGASRGRLSFDPKHPARRRRRTRMSRAGTVVLLWSCLMAAGPSFAEGQGEVRLAWDPAFQADGYRVHWSTTGPDTYPSSKDVGLSTTYDFTQMEDCTTYWIATTAYNVIGSSGYSAGIETWPRPRVTAVTCDAGNTLEPGASASCTVTGHNLKEGAVLSLADPSGNDVPGVAFANATVAEFCHTMTFSLTLPGPSICPGGCTLGLRVRNPSGVASAPFGALTIDEPLAPPALIEVR
jgi:hypothetical protein